MSPSRDDDSPSPESSSSSSSPSPPMPIYLVYKRRGVICDFAYFGSVYRPLTSLYPEFANAGDVLVIGGFKPIPTDNPGPGLRSIVPAFPPPDNSSYELDSHCRLPYLHPHLYPNGTVYISKGRGSTELELAMRLDLTAENLARLEHLTAAAEAEAEDSDTSTGTESEGLMINIKSTKPTPAINHAATQKPPGVEQVLSGQNSGTNLLFGKGDSTHRGPLVFRAEDLEMFNNDEHGDGRGQPDYCKICKKAHIPPGGPFRKGDRNEPFSRLPAWFPRNDKGKPVESFAELMRELIVLQDIEKHGYPPGKSDPHEVWDMHFHEKSRVWSTKHSREWGGWWKCRSTDDAPLAEQECIHCHRPKTRAQMEEQAMVPPLKVKIQFLTEYLDHHSMVQGMKERAVALAMMRRDGIPNHFNNPISDKDRVALMNARPGVRTSATSRPIGPRLLDDAAKITAVIKANADAESEGSLGNPRTPMRSFFMQDSDL